MDRSVEKNYKFSNVTDKQIKAMGVQALANRPNAAGQYGQAGLSAEALKLWFDKLSTLLASKINEIQDAISGEDAAKYIGLAVGKYTSLDELLASMQNGEFADEVLKVFPRADVFEAQSLQSIINGIAQSVSELEENKLDKKKPGARSAYTVEKDGENGTVEISSMPKPLTIPLYDEMGELKTALPTQPSSALNLGYFNLYMSNMAEHIGAGVNFTMDPKTYIVTIEVLNRSGKVIYRTFLDLPLEEAIVGGNYDAENKKIVLSLRSGEKIYVPVADLVNGLVTEAKHNADMKALNDKLDAVFEKYVEELAEVVGGDYVDYS